MDRMQPALGERLRAEGNRRGESLRSLAVEIGISFNSLSRIERGLQPSLANYQRVASWLEDQEERIVAEVAWALHCWSCPLCFENGVHAMASSDQDHVTDSDRMQAEFLVSVLGLAFRPS